MNSHKMRAFVSLVAAICLGAGLTIVIRSMKVGLPLNDDPLALLRLPVRQVAYWEDHFKRPLTERIGLPTEDVLSYMRADNVAQGYSEVPIAADHPDAIKNLREALSGLPAPILKKLESKLAAIFLVKDLGGTAISNTIYQNGPDSPQVAGFIAFDVSILNKKANEWATWKDQSPFQKGHVSIRTTIAEKKDDTIIGAYQFILLHEIGHILAIGEKIHPNWDIRPTDMEGISFGGFSWVVKDSTYERDDRFGALELPDVAFYQDENSKRPSSDIIPIYEALEQSPFLTLYATTNPYDDFADTFATYVHTQVLAKPYRVEILEGKKVVKTFELCFGKFRCKQKEDFVKTFVEKLAP